jgi:hypothetical protein
MNYELPSAPLSIGGVLDSAIRLYRYVIRRCWGLALIYAGLLGVFGLIWGVALAKSFGPGGRPDPAVLSGLILSPVTICGFLLAIVLSTAVYGALVKSTVALARGEELSLGSALGVGLQRLPGILLASLLCVLAVGVGFILLIIPGIYVIGKLQLWLVAMFAEDASAIESLQTSWRLTAKRWWRGFTILSVAGILIYVFAFAFGIIAGIVGGALHIAATDRLIVNQAVSVLSNIIVMPMTVAISVVMYNDFKLRSQGGDLALRVGSLGKA